MKRLRLLALSIVTISSILALCYVVFMVFILSAEDIEDWFNVMQTSQGLPDAHVRFDELYNEIDFTNEDVLLEEIVPEPLHVPPHYYTHCIRGRKTKIYGSYRLYENVYDSYKDG